MATRLFKILIGLVTYLFDYCSKTILKILRDKSQSTCVVLYYHAVSNEQRDRFARQMDDLIRWTTPVNGNIDSVPENGRRYSAITFDDGFTSVLDNAIPELSIRNIPCIIFIPTGSLGRHPIWVKDPENQSYKEIVISTDQIKRLDKELVSIGSHCVTHTNLLLLNEEEIRKELIDSRMKLKQIVKKDISSLSFPHGQYSQKIVNMAIDAGYKRLFTILPILSFSKTKNLMIGRVEVSPDDWRIEFRLKLLGAYRWMPIFFKLKKYVRNRL